MPGQDRNARHRDLAVLACAAALSLGAGMLLWRRSTGGHRSDDAPGRAARRLDFGGYQVVGRTVTIAAPRSAVHAPWRDPAQLNRIFGGGLKVRPLSEDRMAWILATPSGDIEVETRLVEERAGEILAWRSVDGSGIDVEAKLQLRDAPAGRGTEVEAHIAWRPPWGLPGHWAARLGGTDPGRLCRQALKRLKMLLETGEIATADNRRDS